MAKKRNTKKLTYLDLVKKKVPYVLIPGILTAIALGWSASTIKQSTTYNDIQEIFPYSGTVQSVQDGDTFELSTGHRVRLIGVNAPDRGDSNYQNAKQNLIDLIQNERVYLEYDRYQDDKYGRLLAWVWIQCESNPMFLPAQYMHKSNNTSQKGLADNPEGCKNGALVNEELTAYPYITFTNYKDRGELKYQKRIQQKQISH